MWGAPGVMGNCAYVYDVDDLLADPGGVGRPTGLKTGVTGSPPLAPETEVPVRVLRDHAGLDTYDGEWRFDEDMAAVSQSESEKLEETDVGREKQAGGRRCGE